MIGWSSILLYQMIFTTKVVEDVHVNGEAGRHLEESHCNIAALYVSSSRTTYPCDQRAKYVPFFPKLMH